MPHHTSDTRITGYEPLLAPAALLAELPMGADRETTVEQGRADIRRVLDLADDRLLVIVGPCSVHDPVAALDYARQLAEIRRAEQKLALGRLGLGRTQVHRCGLPDGHLDRYEAELADALTPLLDEHTWCLTTWAHDGHPDHEATARSAATAAGRTGQSNTARAHGSGRS